jgi:predicted DNA-binding protein (MmcQ/YjbR family)
MEGYHLNKKHWNTVLLTGQLPWEEIQGLIRHSYELVAHLPESKSDITER